MLGKVVHDEFYLTTNNKETLNLSTKHIIIVTKTIVIKLVTDGKSLESLRDSRDSRGHLFYNIAVFCHHNNVSFSLKRMPFNMIPIESTNIICLHHFLTTCSLYLRKPS